MERFELDELLVRQAAAIDPYLEFQRSADLSTGLYLLAAGAIDRQQPHTEDEIYVVMAGRALFRAGDEEVSVQTGTVLLVPAGLAHRFHRITEELRILVVFGPAEGSRRR